MAKRPRTWKCQKTQGGVKCHHVNPKRNLICLKCGKKRPATKKPAHAVALELPYEAFVFLNGGDHCGICGYVRKPGDRHLDRDHAWVGPIKGKPRGLLCHSCNRTLSKRMEIAAAAIGLVVWLNNAADYVEKAQRQAGMDARAFL